MDKPYKINRDDWQRVIQSLTKSHTVYAPVRKETGIDYSLIDGDTIDDIVYNEAKPASPLKIFFLPVKVNVTKDAAATEKMVIIGAPSCDIEGLRLLDLIYLDSELVDDTYRIRRENSLLIATDCYTTQEHCHCTTYDINPYCEKGCDISLSSDKEDYYLTICSEKGERFISESVSPEMITPAGEKALTSISEKRARTKKALSGKNKDLPGSSQTNEMIKKAGNEIWKRYSSECVSCGACSAICPTCTCFLLIDRPDFEKVKQLDTCQYPAFERVAGGEDPLRELSVRFRNRYMCKYIWKPERFDTVACTGCGRCIEGCIAGISKNKLIMELT